MGIGHCSPCVLHSTIFTSRSCRDQQRLTSQSFACAASNNTAVTHIVCSLALGPAAQLQALLTHIRRYGPPKQLHDARDHLVAARMNG